MLGKCGILKVWRGYDAMDLGYCRKRKYSMFLFYVLNVLDLVKFGS